MKTLLIAFSAIGIFMLISCILAAICISIAGWEQEHNDE